jgi:hypothetical protein
MTSPAITPRVTRPDSRKLTHGEVWLRRARTWPREAASLASETGAVWIGSMVITVHLQKASRLDWDQESTKILKWRKALASCDAPVVPSGPTASTLGLTACKLNHYPQGDV